MPKSKPCFSVPIKDTVQITDTNIKGIFDEAVKDPKVRVKGKKVEIDYAYDDFMLLYRTLKSLLDTGPRQSWHERYATKAYKEEMEGQLDQARDHFRDFDYDKAPVKDPNIPPTANGKDATKHVLASNGGMVMANEHGDQHTKDLLVQAMDSDDVGLIFVEEFKVSLQPVIEDYLTGTDDKFPPVLQTVIDDFKRAKGVDFGPLLQKAREKKAKIYGIDGADAHYLENSDPRHHEDRCASMNQISEKVMREAVKANPGKKFVALCGAAHANTHEGGLPGLAQIMGVPTVSVSPTGKMTFEAEDPSVRTMPSKEEQAFADQYALEVAAEYKDYKSKNDTENFDMMELVAEATHLAKKLKADGKLNSPKDVAKLLKDSEVTNKKQAYIQRTADRKATRENLKKHIDGGRKDDMVELLKKFKKDDPYGFANEHEMTGTTLLHHAADQGQVDCIEELVSQFKMDLEVRDVGPGEVGSTPLHRAAKAGKAAAVQKLLIKGADPDARTKKENLTALHLAAETDPASVRSLLAGGAQVDLKDEKGQTPLHRAAAAGLSDSAGALMVRGADVDVKDADGNTPAHLAAQKGSDGVLTALTKALANFDIANKQGKKPLHIAAERGNTAACDALVTGGAPIDGLDTQGNSALHLAINAGKGATGSGLLAKGASAALKNTKGDAPLHLAAAQGLNGLVSELIDTHGQDPKATDSDGKTAMQLAMGAQQGKGQAIVDNLLDRAGQKPLMTALIQRFSTDAKQEHAKTKAPTDPDLNDKELTEVATLLAGKLIEGGKLTAVGDLDTVAGTTEYKNEITEVIKRTKARAKTFGTAKDALQNNNAANLKKLLTEDPGLKYYVDPADDKNLLHWAARLRRRAASMPWWNPAWTSTRWTRTATLRSTIAASIAVTTRSKNRPTPCRPSCETTPTSMPRTPRARP